MKARRALSEFRNEPLTDFSLPEIERLCKTLSSKSEAS